MRSPGPRPPLEKAYLERGVIEGGVIFAYNHLVMVGPAGDPAGVKGAGSAVEAFKLIYEAGERGEAKFVSRGDCSGTHVREPWMWRAAGLNPRGRPWYLETGQGMTETLVMADEVGGYALSDASTFTLLKGRCRA